MAADVPHKTQRKTEPALPDPVVKAFVDDVVDGPVALFAHGPTEAEAVLALADMLERARGRNLTVAHTITDDSADPLAGLIAAARCWPGIDRIYVNVLPDVHDAGQREEARGVLGKRTVYLWAPGPAAGEIMVAFDGFVPDRLLGSGENPALH